LKIYSYGAPNQLQLTKLLQAVPRNRRVEMTLAIIIKLSKYREPLAIAVVLVALNRVGVI